MKIMVAIAPAMVYSPSLWFSLATLRQFVSDHKKHLVGAGWALATAWVIGVSSTVIVLMVSVGQIEKSLTFIERGMIFAENVPRDIRTQFARQTLFEPIKTTVLVTAPDLTGGKWMSTVNMYDVEHGKQKVYRAVVSGPLRPRVDDAVYMVDDRALSVATMEAIALQAGELANVPGKVAKEESIISYKSASEFEAIFEAKGYALVSQSDIPKRNYPLDAVTDGSG